MNIVNSLIKFSLSSKVFVCRECSYHSMISSLRVYIAESVPTCVSTPSCILQTLNILWAQLHAGEFLREMFCVNAAIQLRNIGWSYPLIVYSSPVYICKPRVFFYQLDTSQCVT